MFGLLAGMTEDHHACTRPTSHDGVMRRLRYGVRDYFDYRAPIRALVLVGVGLFGVALVLMLLLPHPPVVQLAGVFAIAITGSWFLRTGIRVNRERKEDALVDSETDHGHRR